MEAQNRPESAWVTLRQSASAASEFSPGWNCARSSTPPGFFSPNPAPHRRCSHRPCVNASSSSWMPNPRIICSTAFGNNRWWRWVSPNSLSKSKCPNTLPSASGRTTNRSRNLSPRIATTPLITIPHITKHIPNLPISPHLKPTIDQLNTNPRTSTCNPRSPQPKLIIRGESGSLRFCKAGEESGLRRHWFERR